MNGRQKELLGNVYDDGEIWVYGSVPSDGF
jgi:hypothetical protein